jgi:hypothetical protein
LPTAAAGTPIAPREDPARHRIAFLEIGRRNRVVNERLVNT